MAEEAIPSAAEAVSSKKAAETAYAPELGTDAEGKAFYKVRIADPFIELHTGPGAGYPIFYVVDRGTEVSVIRRKNRLVSESKTNDGKTGWGEPRSNARNTAADWRKIQGCRDGPGRFFRSVNGLIGFLRW